jgi:dolichol-phosphate mannosyltransferase
MKTILPSPALFGEKHAWKSISIVIPVYNEQENLPEIRKRLEKVLHTLNIRSSEIIFVSDGSKDDSEALITEMAKEDSRIRGIFLARNFGHQAALSIGLSEARGEVVAVLDGDLQDPPETIIPMLDELSRGADVAFGVRQKRKENFFKRFCYWLFYRTLKIAANIDIPLDAGDFACMRKRVVDAMSELPETNKFLRGIRSWVGFKHVGVPYHRQKRFAGRSKFKSRQLIQLAYDGLFTFTDIPIKLMQIFGFFLSIMSFFVGIIYFILAFTTTSPKGFPTLIISIWFLSGIQMFTMGLLGEYLHRTFQQSLRRPVAIIRDTVGSGLASL